ncbi:MAG: hypothetical protein HUJ54_11100, partial [Erysipelotrichaceae bacterium]|nr:hypothetical protein [Erysipelotrichaceae bacterium]
MKQKTGYLENSKSIQNLRRRIFWILFGLLAFFCGMVLILSLWRDYSDLKRNVGEVMKQASSYNYAFRPGYSEEEDSPIKQHTALSGLPVFTLRVKDGQGLAFYYQNTTEEEALEASQYATDIVQYARPGEIHVGNLYSDQYVWDYSNPGTFSMVDVSSLGTQLRDILGLSMVFYVLFLAVT